MIKKNVCEDCVRNHTCGVYVDFLKDDQKEYPLIDDCKFHLLVLTIEQENDIIDSYLERNNK
jgi:hypothetical protein